MAPARRPNIGTYPESPLYSEVIFRCGGLPVALSPPVLAPGPDSALASLGGIWIAGGELELGLGLVGAALRRKLPLLATGRGLPLLNRFLGGRERALSPTERPEHLQVHSIEQPHHPVEIAEESVLSGCLGAGQLMINSVCDCVPEQVGEGLVVSARSYDGVVEALELPAPLFVVGVQWEPQRLLSSIPVHRGLFDALVAAARR